MVAWGWSLDGGSPKKKQEVAKCENKCRERLLGHPLEVTEHEIHESGGEGREGVIELTEERPTLPEDQEGCRDGPPIAKRQPFFVNTQIDLSHTRLSN